MSYSKKYCKNTKNRRKSISLKSLGIVYDFKSMVIIAVLLVIASIGASFLYKLEYYYTIILAFTGLMIAPMAYKSKVLYKFEENRFLEITAYMEQMCSSFNVSPIIRDSLIETSTIFTNERIKSRIYEAISMMDNTNTTIEECMGVIEKDYSCDKLSSLHKMFLQIISEGGEYRRSLAIILQDITNWKERILLYQLEKKTLKINYIIGVCLSVLCCSLATALSIMSDGLEDDLFNTYLDITPNNMYQVISFIFIFLLLISYNFIEKKYTDSWLEVQKKEKLIIADYNIFTKYNYKKGIIKSIPVSFMFFVFSGTVYYFRAQIPLFYMAIILFSLMGILIMLFPVIKWKGAKQRTTKELKTAFAEWLIAIELNLQFDTLQVAIDKSIEKSPIVLREELIKMQRGYIEEPTSIKPYNEFLEIFDIIEIRSAMRKLSAFKSYNFGDSKQILDDLIKTVFKLQDRQEKEKIKEKIFSMKALTNIPLGFAGAKIAGDLLIFSSVFFNGFSDMSNFIS